MEKVEEYLKLRQDQSPFVFVSHSNNRPSGILTSSAVQDIVKKYKTLC